MSYHDFAGIMIFRFRFKFRIFALVVKNVFETSLKSYI